MQLSNLVLRLGGSQLHTVPITQATPAEILVLQHIHGADAVTEVRPTKIDKNRRHASEFERLASKYDRAASSNEPGEDRASIMNKLFPGAMKKLPTTLKEIGLGHLMSTASIEATERSQPTPGEGEETILTTGAEDGEGEGDDGDKAGEENEG